MNNNRQTDASFWHGPVQHEITLHAEDRHIDMFDHVNNAWYIAWAMECAWAHSEALGLDFAAYQRIGIGCVVRQHAYRYMAPALCGDELAVGTWIRANDGKLRLDRAIEIRRVRDGTLLVAGETQFVSINLKTGRPARMPPDYVRLYAPARQP